MINKIELEIKRLKKLKDPDNEYVIMDLEQEKKELKRLQAASSQAGGPSHKESGHKLNVLTTEEYKILWDKYE